MARAQNWQLPLAEGKSDPWETDLKQDKEFWLGHHSSMQEVGAWETWDVWGEIEAEPKARGLPVSRHTGWLLHLLHSHSHWNQGS